VSLIAEGGKNEDRIVTLTGSELLIVDGSSNTPIGLAGVKGGAYAGVDAQTKNIIVEAAHFDPIITRKTARKLGIVIDASKRFENNPSPQLIPYALKEVALLIQEIANGTCAGSIDIDHTVKDKIPTSLEVSRVNALLGLKLSSQEIVSLLKRIGASVEDAGQTLLLQAPFERTDLSIPEDYIEEIGRIYGYEHVVSELPLSAPLTEINSRHYYSEKVRHLLLSMDFSEVITSSFNKKDEIQLRNALASDKSYLRSTLKKSITEVLDKNANLVDLLGTKDTRVFEIGTVFTKKDGMVFEHVALCCGVRTKINGCAGADDVLLATVTASIEEALGTSMSFDMHNGTAESNFTDVLVKLPAPTAYEEVEVAKEIVYKPFSVYPAMSRDIALWVSEGVKPESVVDILNLHAGQLRVRTSLVDVFSKEGRTSFAFRLVFQSYDRTLTDAEVHDIMENVYGAVRAQGWETR